MKYTTNNVAALQNTIAVRNDFKNENGEYDSQFINFVAYRNNADFLSRFAKKGSKVLIEGKINTRDYDKQDGTKAYVTEVIAERVELLNSPAKEKQQESSEEKDDPFYADGFKTKDIEFTDSDFPF